LSVHTAWPDASLDGSMLNDQVPSAFGRIVGAIAMVLGVSSNLLPAPGVAPRA